MVGVLAVLSRERSPSVAKASSVPSPGTGRTSQRISDRSSITPVVSWSEAKRSNSAQVSNAKGSPAVGSCWNIKARLEA